MNNTDSFLSNEQLLDVLTLNKIATAIHVTEDAVIEYANNAMLKIWGKDKSVIGKKLVDALPELKGQPFIDMFKRVWNEGITISGKDAPADLVVDGKLQTFYFDFEYAALKDDNDSVYCILHTAHDITERYLSRQREQKLSEELSVLNEELTASNEELITSNEEMAATNEELAATNEELAATNEELRVLTEEFSNSREQLLENKETIERAEQMLRLAVEAANIGSWFIEPVTKQLKYNATLAKIFGYEGEADMTYEQAIGQVSKIYRQQIESAMELAIAEGGDYDITYAQHRFNDSELIWIRSLGKVTADQHKGISTFAGVVMDITDLIKTRHAEQRLNDQLFEINEALTGSNVELTASVEKSAAINKYLTNLNKELIATQERLEVSNDSLGSVTNNLQRAIDLASIDIWKVDLTTGLLTITERTRKLHGIAPDVPFDFHQSLELITPSQRAGVAATIKEAIDRNNHFTVQYQIEPLDGEKPRWMNSSGQVYKNANGEPISMSGIMMDITEQKADEQRKNDFIGMVSHELKTPLTSLSAYIQMLQAKAIKGEDGLFINALNKSNIQVKKMNKMINGFLNLSRLESGKIQINKNQFDIVDLLREIIDETVVMVSSHVISFSPCAPIIINADRDKISSVITNLVSNAVKYSPTGTTIEITCIVNKHDIKVSVADEGVGIAPEDSSKLFERYYRVQNSKTDIISGFGIGLYLSAEIVQRHSGKIGVDSEPGKGSNFWFTLPHTS